MKVTFDTNTIDRAVRPERFPKDPRQSEYIQVQQALASGRIQGFISETLFSLEGMQRLERAGVFGGTTTVTHESEAAVETASGNGTAIQITIQVQQPDRKPLHPEMARRIKAALDIGMRFLSAPRTGAIKIDDPDHMIYAAETQGIDLRERLNRYHNALRSIEERGVGMTLCKQLGQNFSAREKIHEPWFKGLQRARDVHEQNQVARAFAEWADADAIAAHVGYGIDYFCTEDAGKSAGAASILDATNSAWLTAQFGVRFVSLSDLASMI
jgi:hypothetical protein